jgi:uncharacterized protein YdhG (YjbR/CyaY superfamily)
MKGNSKDADEYIDNATTDEIQSKLKQLRATIKEAAPSAIEGISYEMPYYDYKGQLVWFALLKSHIGVYFRPPLIQDYKKELTKYRTTKSAIHFPLDEKLPISLIKKLIKASS